MLALGTACLIAFSLSSIALEASFLSLSMRGSWGRGRKWRRRVELSAAPHAHGRASLVEVTKMSLRKPPRPGRHRHENNSKRHSEPLSCKAAKHSQEVGLRLTERGWLTDNGCGRPD